MEYKDYINSVISLLDDMDEYDKTVWIYEYARRQNKENRKAFLDSLTPPIKKVINFDENEFHEFIEDVKNQALFIETREEEYYDESIHNVETKTIYLQNCELLTRLNYYINIGIDLIANEDNEIGFDVLDQISQLVITTNNEYGYIEELSLRDLFGRNLIKTSRYNYYLNLLYAAFTLHKSITEIYLIFKQYDHHDILFSDLLAFGKHELNFDHQFYQEWIDFLENEPGNLSAYLIKDACYLDGGIIKLLATIDTIGEIHPLLYQEALSYYLNRNDYQQMVQIGLQALKRIPEQFKIRAKIAASIKPYYDNTCYLNEVIFLSEPTPYNCLKLYNENVDFDYIIETFKQINYQNDISLVLNDDEYAICHIDDKQRLLLEFLLGNIEKAIQLYDESRGYPHLRDTVILLVLMLLKSDDYKYVANRDIMNDTKKLLNIPEDKNNSFQMYFKLWKQSLVISPIQKEKLLNWIIKVVTTIVERKLENNALETYKQLADIIVILAQILAENNIIDDEQSYIKKYLQEYNHKYTFKERLINASKIITQIEY